MYLQASLTYSNVLAKLELDYAHLLRILVKNAKFIKKILTFFHLKILINFSLNERCFTQTTKIWNRSQNSVYLRGLKIMLKLQFLRIFSAKFEKLLKLQQNGIISLLAYINCLVITYGYDLSRYQPSKISHFRQLPVFMLKLWWSF